MIMVGAWARSQAQTRRRSGITLTEILIAIMILGIGLVSLATLFPIGLLRLRDATRYSRSAFLTQSAAADTTARGLFNSQSFRFADALNFQAGLPVWYPSQSAMQQQKYLPFGYNPLIDDTASYGPWDPNNPGAHASGGPGLPFAYDPLWRFWTVSTAHGTNGYYNHDTGNGGTNYEARFGYGVPFIRPIGGVLPSAWGLQRITNFNRPNLMPAANNITQIFVSPEDVVWQEPTVTTYTVVDGVDNAQVAGPSPVLPDLNTSGGVPTIDWRYSWMFTGQQTSANNASSFDGNIVIFENRVFGIIHPASGPYSQGDDYQVAGETVVEAVYGYSTNVLPPGGPGYGANADRTVLLRWNAAMPDPVVRAGDWFADVTYERSQAVVKSVWWNNPVATGVGNPANNGEWDNLPAQRCYWYQVQKATPPAIATGNLAFNGDPPGVTYRYMTVYINQPLISRTLLDGNGNPVVTNAALIVPNVVNVIPQTIFVR
jgi:hypothetical protein